MLTRLNRSAPRVFGCLLQRCGGRGRNKTVAWGGGAFRALVWGFRPGEKTRASQMG